MFVSAIIPLQALNTPPPEQVHFFGREAHALFLNLVARADAALGHALHEPRANKPFTVSGLRARPIAESASARLRHREPILAAGTKFEWRVTTFDRQLSEVMREKILTQLPGEVRLGAARFEVGAPVVERAQHLWAGVSDAQALWQKWFHAARRVDKHLTLEFASPTAIRHIHRNMLLPLPEGIFTGYLAAWNAHCAPQLEQDLIAQAQQLLAIRQYDLHTRKIDFGEFRESGWQGRCTYALTADEMGLCRALHLLADFAFYCGTGYKTTQGMGQTRTIRTQDTEGSSQ